MNKNFIMLSGLPRSGSSVLASMLNQHPKIFASTTSPVIDLLEIIVNNWTNVSAALRNPYVNQQTNIVAGMIDGAYLHIEKPIIIDKNRLWPRHAALMQNAIGSRPKIICTVRSIPDILASYILLIRRNAPKITWIDQDLLNQNQLLNDKNRCRIIWEKYMNHPYNSLVIGRNSKIAEMLWVEYDDIVNNSQTVMDRICGFIGTNTHTVDITSLQPMDENDQFHGGMEGLHEVRRVMSRTSPPAQQVIGRDLVKLYTDMKLDFWRR